MESMNIIGTFGLAVLLIAAYVSSFALFVIRPIYGRLLLINRWFDGLFSALSGGSIAKRRQHAARMAAAMTYAENI